jgi:hypothetical protein
LTKLGSIKALKANVTQQEAVLRFSAPGFSSIYWRLRSGRLQKIAKAYVPYWLYRVRYEHVHGGCTRFFAMDAVNGSLDLFEFPHVPSGEEVILDGNRNCLQPTLSEVAAEGILRDKVLRVVFQQGFFRLRMPRLEIAREPLELYLPYWLGFYEGHAGVRCRVMDAVRRRIEGAKASAFFEQWLAA